MKTFRPAEHIRRRADFEETYDSGTRASGRLMTLFARQTSGPVARLGIAATRKLGGAVKRNRAKRLVRELFRQRKPAAGLDIIVVPRREFFDASFDSLTREFSALLDRIGKRSGERAATPRRGRRDGAGTHPRV